MLDKLDLSTKAQELRESLGEDANSPVDIFSLVNQIDGLTLVFYPLGENISGICVRDNEIRLIAINSTMSYGRQRFSLAHELYHLYYDDESGFNVCSTKLNPKSENEKCADQFASFFLAPYKSLRTAIKKLAGKSPLSIQHVIALEQYFGMSHLAMFWRLVSEGYISSDKLDDYSYGVISAAAAAIAFQLNPLCADYMLASHCSGEPAASGLLQMMHLKMRKMHTLLSVTILFVNLVILM